MRKKLDVSIIIISFNTREMTLECIQSVIDQTKHCSYEIIVLDNMSEDGSAEAIKKRFSEIKLIDNKKNLGFARGNNFAAKLALGKRLLLLNPDTVILDGAIDKIISYANKTPEAMLWGGKTVFEDGSINASCWMDTTLWSLFCRAFGLNYLFPKLKWSNPETIHAWNNLDTELKVDIVVGCFLLIDRDLWIRLNGFNPIFFMYGDEVDLCIRARKMGASPRITPTAKIIHYGGGSEPSTEDKLIKVFKGRITVMKCHWNPVAAKLGSAIMFITVGIRVLFAPIFKSPVRKGAGQDGKTQIWSGVLKRRKEWIKGWPLKVNE